MRRCLFILFSLLALLPATVVLPLWVISYWRFDALTWFHQPWGGVTEETIGSHKGRVFFGRGPWSPSLPVKEGQLFHESGPASDTVDLLAVMDRSISMAQGTRYVPTYVRFPGGGFCRSKLGGSTELEIIVPYWLTALIAFGLAAPCAVRLHRRQRTHQCVRCGYNLTGNVSGVCPECGESVAKADTEDRGNAQP